MGRKARAMRLTAMLDAAMFHAAPPGGTPSAVLTKMVITNASPQAQWTVRLGPPSEHEPPTDFLTVGMKPSAKSRITIISLDAMPLEMAAAEISAFAAEFPERFVEAVVDAIDRCGGVDRLRAEMVRVDKKPVPAIAGKTTVRLEPGNGLGMLLATCRARRVDDGVVDRYGHDFSPVGCVATTTVGAGARIEQAVPAPNPSRQAILDRIQAEKPSTLWQQLLGWPGIRRRPAAGPAIDPSNPVSVGGLLGSGRGGVDPGGSLFSAATKDIRGDVETRRFDSPRPPAGDDAPYIGVRLETINGQPFFSFAPRTSFAQINAFSEAVDRIRQDARRIAKSAPVAADLMSDGGLSCDGRLVMFNERPAKASDIPAGTLCSLLPDASGVYHLIIDAKSPSRPTPGKVARGKSRRNLNGKPRKPSGGRR